MMNKLPCLQFIANDQPYIIPASGVQDILPMKTFTDTSEPFEWLIGMMTYSDREIPIIQLDFKASNPSILFKEKLAKLVIMHNIARNPAYPYFGLVVANIPKMMTAMADDLYYVNENESIHDFVRGKDAQGYIPNFEEINGMLSKIKDGSMNAPK